MSMIKRKIQRTKPREAKGDNKFYLFFGIVYIIVAIVTGTICDENKDFEVLIPISFGFFLCGINCLIKSNEFH